MLKRWLGHRAILKPDHSPARSKRKCITDILSYTNGNIPYYKGRYAEFLNKSESLSDAVFWNEFAALPHTPKDDVIAYNSDFLPDHFKHKTDLLKNGATPSLWKAVWHGLIKRDFYASLSTGGSSGRSAFRFVDYNDANSFAQSFLQSFLLNGWQHGENFTVFYPLQSYFTGMYADHKHLLRHVFGFTMEPFERLSIDEVRAMLETLTRTKSTLLVIFPCVLQRVAELMLRHNIPPYEDLKYINVSGEFFLDCSKNFIQEMFLNARIDSTYGAVEFGEIAHQAAESQFDYKVFGDYAHIENGPTFDGAETLLVTTLKQHAFPLIKYQIEDKATLKTTPDGIQTLSTLEGKTGDYLTGLDGKYYYASFFNDLINEINTECENTILHFMLRHNEDILELNFILKYPSEHIEKQINNFTQNKVAPLFKHRITTHYPEHFDHDYTRKFKIIGEGDGLSEVVGGYYTRQSP